MCFSISAFALFGCMMSTPPRPVGSPMRALSWYVYNDSPMMILFWFVLAFLVGVVSTGRSAKRDMCCVGAWGIGGARVECASERTARDSDNQATILLDEIEIWRTSNNCTGLKSSIATGDRQWRPVIVETDRPRISCRGLGSYIQFRFSRPPLRVMGWLQREGSLMRGFVCMLTRPHADLEKGFSRFAGGV